MHLEIYAEISIHCREDPSLLALEPGAAESNPTESPKLDN